MRTIAALVLLGLCTTAHAETVISTSLLDVNPRSLDDFALKALCTVANASGKQVVVDSVRFLNENGAEYPQILGSNCSYPNPIFPGLACHNGVGKDDLPATGYIRCEVDVGKGNAKSLRVTLEIENDYLTSPSSRPPTFRTDVGR